MAAICLIKNSCFPTFKSRALKSVEVDGQALEPYRLKIETILVCRSVERVGASIACFIIAASYEQKLSENTSIRTDDEKSVMGPSKTPAIHGKATLIGIYPLIKKPCDIIQPNKRSTDMSVWHANWGLINRLLQKTTICCFPEGTKHIST